MMDNRERKGKTGGGEKEGRGKRKKKKGTFHKIISRERK